jgi:flavin-dependent dehydrogenase
LSFDKQPADRYDVAILGGGLAGLTLALQIKQARPETTVFIAEKRPGLAPEAAFKVGESTQSIACNYFGKVLGLEEHLVNDQVEKCGLRFWFPAGDNSSLAGRIELGPRDYPLVPTWQFDRGRFENFLAKKNLELGNGLFQGSFITGVELGDPHKITIVRGGPGGKESTIQARWIVDATGRSFMLKRKLGLFEENGHNVNSAWFRLAGGLDLEDWVDPDDADFFGRMKERGLRRYSTNHLCGKGYWMWMIQLASGPISIGIVADPRFHPMDQMDTLDKAQEWIRQHEPQLGAALDSRRDQVEDFLKIENFSYGCTQCYDGAARWALVGEAGAFLDPFYSPGSDFISLANTLATDLVTRELSGEDVAARAKAHDDFYLSAYRTCLTQYEDQYGNWGNALLMSLKVCVENIYYWGSLSLLFFHRKLGDLELMTAVRPDFDRMCAALERFESLIREWHALEDREWVRGMVPVWEFSGWLERTHDLVADLDDAQIEARMAANAELMEAILVLAFHRAARNLGDQAPGEDTKINPHAISLDPERWEADGLFDGTGLTANEARQTDAAGLELMYVERIAEGPLSNVVD